jgi:hypothetical protein
LLIVVAIKTSFDENPAITNQKGNQSIENNIASGGMVLFRKLDGCSL